MTGFAMPFLQLLILPIILRQWSSSTSLLCPSYNFQCAMTVSACISARLFDPLLRSCHREKFWYEATPEIVIPY